MKVNDSEAIDHLNFIFELLFGEADLSYYQQQFAENPEAFSIALA